MFFNQGTEITSALFKTRALKRRVPLFAAWNITFRCNLHCQYCGVNNVSIPELGTQEVLARLDQLWLLGVRWITFGGGEPLMRNDIGVILRYAKHKGFYVYLSTNGWLAPQKSKDIQGVDHINLSLDGTRKVHDRIRGQGAYDHAIASIEVFKQLKIPISLLCVLSKQNLNQIQDVLSLAAEFGILAMFQPATLDLNISSGQNPVYPSVEGYRRVIALLVDLKKKGAPVRNSLTGLKHLSKWPNPARIWCPAGVSMLVMQPNGVMNACRTRRSDNLCCNHDNRSLTIKEQFADLKIPANCLECWCSPVVELSLIMSLKPEPLWNAFRLFR